METEPELEQEEELELELETLVALVDGAGGGGSTGGDKQSFDEATKKSMIGKTIKGYNPTFNAAASVQAGTISESDYTPNADYAGTASSKAFTTESLDWKIWGIDADNVYLISATPTSATLNLGEAQGYNNGVYILNEICRTCYTDSKYKDIEVRSMNIRDIEKLYDNSRGIMEYDYSTYNYDSNHKYGANYETYTFTWPTAYTKFDEKDQTKPFDSRNSQSELLQNSDATQASSAKQPYMSLWYKQFGSVGSYSGFAATDEAKGYASMIFDNGTSRIPTILLAGFPLCGPIQQ